MLVNRNLDRSPFTEVSVGSSGIQFNLKLATPSFIEIDGRSLLILAGLRETQIFDGDFFISLFSSKIDYYSQIEGGKYIETETSNTFQNLETGLRMLDFTVADFNNDGTPDIITSFDDSESTDVLGEGIVRYYQLDADGIYQAVPDLFTEINQESGSKFNTILDVNEDGLLDLVITTNSDRETPIIYRSTNVIVCYITLDLPIKYIYLTNCSSVHQDRQY